MGKYVRGTLKQLKAGYILYSEFSLEKRSYAGRSCAELVILLNMKYRAFENVTIARVLSSQGIVFVEVCTGSYANKNRIIEEHFDFAFEDFR